MNLNDPLFIVAVTINAATGQAAVVDSDGRVWESALGGWRVSPTPTLADLERHNAAAAAKAAAAPEGK